MEPYLSRKRLMLALVIAAISDFVSFFIQPILPLQWIVDVATALALFIILGWRWQLLPGLIAETVPVLSLFPVWLLVVAWIGAQDERRRRAAIVTTGNELPRLPGPPPANHQTSSQPHS